MDLGTCQVCGNDDASLALCSDCLGPPPEPIARALARDLGGDAADYAWLSERIATDLGWPGRE